MRINRFVFLDLSTLSLEDHLGVTVSPQSPLSAGYITPSAGEGSLPPRLIPAAARAAPFPLCFRLVHPSPFFCIMRVAGISLTLSIRCNAADYGRTFSDIIDAGHCEHPPFPPLKVSG